MEEEKKEVVVKKKSPIGTIVLVIILMLMCFVGGYLIHEKDFFSFQGNKDEKQVNNSKSKTKDEAVDEEKEVTFSEDDLNKYVNYIVHGSIGPSALLYNTSSVDAEKLSSAEKITYIGAYLQKKAITSEDFQYNILTENDVKNAVEEVYGPGTYEKTTFNLGCGDYILNETDGKYYSKTGCGGTTATFDKNIVLDYKATTKKLEITTGYVIYDGLNTKIYKYFDKTDPLSGYDGGTTDEVNTYLTNFINNNKDLVNHIVYTFESTDGVHYYFKGFTNDLTKY